ncbi:hypothetical protein VNO80_07942 [Phaseolus coccineus]|uniref:Secreted protein n=1 Tax=Phaseolus coccineus TaxID=3886 RepID=A0AAN9NPC4_PHACN
MPATKLEWSRGVVAVMLRLQQATCACASLICWRRCLVDAGGMTPNMQAWKTYTYAAEAHITTATLGGDQW